MELITQTNELLQALSRLKEHFENNAPPEKIKDHQFFEKMKSETNPIFELLIEWEDHALEFVKDKHVHVHPHQIRSTKENMELILLHSYYIDVRKRSYMEMYKSTEYIFNQLLDAIEQKME